jgi:protocatechuate 3,4-dioxygenase beta subunit
MTSMRVAWPVSFAIVAAMAVGTASFQQPVPATSTGQRIRLSGVVVTADQSPTPVRSATISATDVAGRTPETTETDENGRFSFAGLPPGRYDVSAIKAAYLKTSFGMMRPERTGTPVTLAVGEPMVSVTLRMWRGAVITGVVTDSRGRPLPTTVVAARRFQFVNGIRTLATATAGSTTTDDRGIYRIFGLPPGEYAVLTPTVGFGRGAAPTAARQTTNADIERALRGARGGNPTGGAPAPASSPSALAYAPVYFPGTPVALQATPVRVETGEERSGVDFSVPLVPIATVAGSIALPNGVAPGTLQFTVSLTARSAPGDLVLWRPTTTDAKGTFTIGSVTPGEYILSARATQKVVDPNFTGTSLGWWASSPIFVNGADIAGVTLALESGITISGRVVFDGVQTPSADVVAVSVRLTPRGEQVSSQAFGASVTAFPGPFTIPGVVPGEYSLSATLISRVGSATGWTLKGVSVGSQDVSDLPFTIAPGFPVGPVTVAFTNRRTEITGVLQDAAGRPAPDFFIVVLPTDRAFWLPGSRRIVHARPATDGRFTIVGLPAGDYVLAATTDLVPADLLDPTFLGQLLETPVVNVSVKDGEKVTQNIRIAGTNVRER